MKLEIKKCSVCGRTDGVFVKKTRLGVLCHAHYAQLYRYGRITNPNNAVTKLRNTIEDIGNGVSILKIFDRNGNYQADVIFDTEDTCLVSKHRWLKGNYAYAYCGKGNNALLFHRLVMNAGENEIIDHANGNKFDNRKCNLRFCSISQNARNRTKLSHSDSGCIGVTLCKRTGRWIASIKVNYKRIFVGTFDKKEDAIQARLAAEDKYYGEFAPHYNSKFR